MDAPSGKKISSRKRQYDDRKARHVCVDCEAGLFEDDTHVRCVECREYACAYKAKYLANGGQAVETARQNARRAERKAAGRCRYCGGERDEESRAMCSNCRHQHKLWRAGISVVDAEKRAETVPVRMPMLRAEPEAYQTLDEREQNMRVRILCALYWLTHDGDWTSSPDTLQAANVELNGQRGGSRERNRAEVMLRRLVELGLVEREGERMSYVFRISETGRAEVKRYRAGDLPVLVGRRRSA